MKKALTIENLKGRIGKPVFVACSFYREWRVLKNIAFAGVNTIEFTDKSWIAKEQQNKFRFFDTEVSATELKEILDVEEKEKKTGYERVEKGEIYSTINSLKEVTKFIDDEFLEIYTEKRFEAANYFNNENLAENIARAESLRYQLRRYAALNGGIPSQADWEKYFDKYYIYYDYGDNKIVVWDVSISRDFGQIYFKNKEACKKAIEIFKEELIWYFTEFEEQLY